MRYALYFTPAQPHPLTVAAATWLGRDAFTDEAIEQASAGDLSPAEIAAFTAEPRRYGFHATLVAPFRLRDGFGETDIASAAETFASGWQPFILPRLAVSQIGDFLALTPATPNADLDHLASAAVDAFDGLRAPLTSLEIARRKPDKLSERQRRYLERFGYPYVKDEFRFHMTLTGPLTVPEIETIRPLLESTFVEVLAAPIVVDAVALFVEPTPGAPFTVVSTHRFGVAEARKYA